MICSVDRSGASVPVLVLLFVALWFVMRGGLEFAWYCFVLVFFDPLGIAMTALGEGDGWGLVLVLFVCLFDLRLFGFVCFLFLLVSGVTGVGGRLRLVIVALPGLFSYLLLW